MEGIERKLKYQNNINILITSSLISRTIIQTGIEGWFKNKINFLHTLSCPYLYTDLADIELIREFALDEHRIILMKKQSHNMIFADNVTSHNIQIIESESNLSSLALQNPDKEIILFSCGFEKETNQLIPLIKELNDLKIKNFKIFLSHKLLLPAIKNLLNKNLYVDGYLVPQDITLLIGTMGFNHIVNEYGLPIITCGYSEIEILKSIDIFLDALMRNQTEFINPDASQDDEIISANFHKEIYTIFHPKTVRWAGYGIIPFSGLTFNDDYQDIAVENTLQLKKKEDSLKSCIGEKILTLNNTPQECSLFNDQCSTTHPAGVNMACNNGLCHIYSNILSHS